MIRKFLCTLIILTFCGISHAGQQRRLSVVIFPTINNTELEIWQSKYYPYNVLEEKMSQYLESLYKISPLIDARVLDEAGMNRWLSGSRSGDDMAVQLEMYSASIKDKHIVGTATSGRVMIRIRVLTAQESVKLLCVMFAEKVCDSRLMMTRQYSGLIRQLRD